MGFGMEGQILNQAKKGQGETNQRLEALAKHDEKAQALLSEILIQQKRANDLLAKFITLNDRATR